MKSKIYSCLALSAACILLFTACALGFEPAWKGKATSIAFQLAAPALPEASLDARAIAQGGGYIYIRTLGGPTGGGSFYGPYRIGAGEVFETTDIPPGTYDGIGVLYAPSSLESKHIVYPTVDTPFTALMQMPDAAFVAFSSGGDASKLNEMLDGDASGHMLNDVTVKSGTVNSFKLTMEPMTGPLTTLDITASPISLPTAATLTRKFVKITNVTAPVGYMLSEVGSSVPSGTTLGLTAFYDKNGKLLEAFPVPATNPIPAAQAQTIAYTAGDYFYYYIEYQSAAIDVSFTKSDAPIMYTVTFDSQGGSAVSSIGSILHNGTAGTLGVPTRAGYTFSNWYTAPSGGGTQFLSTTPVTANLTVYANWTPIPGTDANLSALTVSGLPISPAFVPATMLYTADATSAVSAVTVTPTLSDPAASIQVKINTGSYSPVASGTASASLVLDDPTGLNQVSVQVTAEDGITILTYTVIVSKTVSVTISAGANGTASPVGTQERTPGNTVPLSATPAPGYRFDSWTGTGNVVPTNSPSANLTVGIANSSTVATFVPDFAGGIGTPGNPYQIATLAQLMNMNNFRTSSFILIANIDLSSETDWTPIGDSTTKFSGGFDGSTFTLSNLTINSALGNRGFFGYTNDAAIVSVTLTNINITTTSGSSFVGGLIGWAGGATSVTDCAVSGVINSYQGVGGLVGNADTGDVLTVYGCSADVDITIPYAGVGTFGGLIGSTKGGSVTRSFATGDVGPHAGGTPSTVGGLIGMNWDNVVTDCYATGNVYGVNNVGGLIGSMTYGSGTSSVARSWSKGLVTYTGTGPGGLVGILGGGCTVTDSFYDTVTSGQTDNVGKGVPQTTANMLLSSTFGTWDFVTVWDNSGDTVYPFLR